MTTRYDVAEHLRTPEEMAEYLEACLEETNGDAAFIRSPGSLLSSTRDAMMFLFSPISAMTTLTHM